MKYEVTMMQTDPFTRELFKKQVNADYFETGDRAINFYQSNSKQDTQLVASFSYHCVVSVVQLSQ